MKILVFDNYDSFTYNLVHLVEKITGEKVDVVRNDQLPLEKAADYDKIILSPGPGIPSEAGSLLPLIKQYAATKSILGVCLGHQAIGEAFGAKLVKQRYRFAHWIFVAKVFPGVAFRNKRHPRLAKRPGVSLPQRKGEKLEKVAFGIPDFLLPERTVVGIVPHNSLSYAVLKPTHAFDFGKPFGHLRGPARLYLRPCHALRTLAQHPIHGWQIGVKPVDALLQADVLQNQQKCRNANRQSNDVDG